MSTIGLAANSSNEGLEATPEALAEYLQESVAKALIEGLAATIKSQPDDPPLFLSRWLLRYVEEHVKPHPSRIVQASYKAPLDGALTVVTPVATSACTNVDTRGLTASDNVAFEAIRATEWVDEKTVTDILDHLRETIGATGVYLAKYEEQVAFKEGVTVPALRYVAADRTHTFMLNHCLPEEEGATWELLSQGELEKGIEEGAKSPKEDSEDDLEERDVKRFLPDGLAKGDCIADNQGSPDIRKKVLFVEEVLDNPRIRYFGLTRPGAYIAVLVELSEVANAESLMALCEWMKQRRAREQMIVRALRMQTEGTTDLWYNTLNQAWPPTKLPYEYSTAIIWPQITLPSPYICRRPFNQEPSPVHLRKDQCICYTGGSDSDYSDLLEERAPTDAEEEAGAMTEAPEPLPPVELHTTTAKYILCADSLGDQGVFGHRSVCCVETYAEELAKAIIRTQREALERQATEKIDSIDYQDFNLELTKLHQNYSEKLQALQEERQAEELQKLEEENANETRGLNRLKEVLEVAKDNKAGACSMELQQNDMDKDASAMDQNNFLPMGLEESEGEEKHDDESPDIHPISKEYVLEAASALAALDCFKQEVLAPLKLRLLLRRHYIAESSSLVSAAAACALLLGHDAKTLKDALSEGDSRWSWDCLRRLFTSDFANAMLAFDPKAPRHYTESESSLQFITKLLDSQTGSEDGHLESPVVNLLYSWATVRGNDSN
ncbi:hypothetical protein cyc_04311 [Cyclospora cayetanensis]|uniref:Uncharacterized protein n=1 Tax=Cyclospora cayetanensis TaxID=88456 RepID=A0A1D3CT72_9EIME|nr:hypothetical protein cyc_04311 [Cyclospora cayetanensis]